MIPFVMIVMLVQSFGIFDVFQFIIGFFFRYLHLKRLNFEKLASYNNISIIPFTINTGIHMICYSFRCVLQFNNIKTNSDFSYRTIERFLVNYT